MASSKKKAKVRRGLPKAGPKRQDVQLHELQAIVEQARPALSDEQHAKLKAAVETLGFPQAVLMSLFRTWKLQEEEVLDKAVGIVQEHIRANHREKFLPATSDG